MPKAEGGIFTFSSSTANSGTPMHLDISSLDLFPLWIFSSLMLITTLKQITSFLLLEILADSGGCRFH